MVNKFKTLFMSLLIVGSMGSAFGQTIDLVIGDLTVDPLALTNASCLQVPILIRDSQDARELKDLTFTVEISGDTGIIDGGIAANMLVANAFGAGATFTGITNPGTDLSNVNGTPTPTCSSIFNQATQGSAPAIDFGMGGANGTWFINNDAQNAGRKSGFVINFGGLTILNTAQNAEVLVGVLEIPIIANPGPSQLMITGTSNGVVADANIYTYDDGTLDENGNRALVTEDLGLGEANGVVSIFEPEDCVGATATDNIGGATGATIGIDYLDPMAGGVGGDITFTMPHSANVDQIVITGSDGYNATVPATGTSTSLSINTQGDASPSTAGNSVTYTIAYEIEFPAASGTFVAGAPCTVTVNWNPTTCTVVCDPQPPVFGSPVAIDVTMTNAVWDAGNSRFGVLTSNAVNWPGDVNLTAPAAAGNTLTFDDAYTIAAAGANDIGNYSTGSTGPGVANTSTCDHLLVLGAPENNINCATDITAPVTIGGTATIQLNGNNVVEWRIEYNGTSTTVPGTDATFDITVSGNATDVTIVATGFDTMGNPDEDPETCTLDFVDPVCVATNQDPDSTVMPVDVGTVIDLELISAGAISATIDAVPMTVGSGVVGSTNQITWDATFTAVIDTVVTAVITNPDGTTTNCTWVIDVNCEPPTLISVAQPGMTGIVIGGTDGCTYDVSIIDASGFCTVVPITVDATGIGQNNSVVIPPDATITLGQETTGCGAGPIDAQTRTVPTLGEWGLIAFVFLLMTAGVFYMRRRRLA